MGGPPTTGPNPKEFQGPAEYLQEGSTTLGVENNIDDSSPGKLKLCNTWAGQGYWFAFQRNGVSDVS